MKIMHVVGARPNFVKIAPLMAELNRYASVEQILVHTGQHYTHGMSQAVVEDLGLRQPDEWLEVGSGSHAVQTARVMLAFEPVLLKHQPDWVVVSGDVNSTLACALVCAKERFKIAHIEAGLRCFDHSLPEEINRVIVDHLSDCLFTHCSDASQNLQREGISAEKIFFVGNIIIDSLIKALPLADTVEVPTQPYILATLHRPFNVDDPLVLASCLDTLGRAGLPVHLPLHPRTAKSIERFELRLSSDIQVTLPLSYVHFLAFMKSATLVVTDSGGVQEETSYLGIPCLVVRPKTERPICLIHGRCRLVSPPTLAVEIESELLKVENSHRPSIPLWDGHTAARMARILLGAAK